MTDYDCTRCGACCALGWSVGVIYGDDVPESLTEFDKAWGEEIMQRRPDGTCIAFEGIVGQECSCSVHEIKPKVCRDFQPGWTQCLDARRDFNLEIKGDDDGEADTGSRTARLGQDDEGAEDARAASEC